MSKRQRNKKRLRLEQKRLKAVVAAAAIGTTVGVSSPLYAEEVSPATAGAGQVAPVPAEENATTEESPEVDTVSTTEVAPTVAESPAEETGAEAVVPAPLDTSSLAQTLATLRTLLEQSAATNTSEKTPESLAGYEAALATARQEEEKAALLLANGATSQAEVEAQDAALVAVISNLSQAKNALVDKVVVEEGAAESSTAATEAEKQASPDNTSRTVSLTYTVEYVNRQTGEVVFSIQKEKAVTTTEAVATASVTEIGAELTNEAALADFYVPDGLETQKTVELSEGTTTKVTYPVERFQNFPAEAPRRVRRAAEENPVTIELVSVSNIENWGGFYDKSTNTWARFKFKISGEGIESVNSSDIYDGRYDAITGFYEGQIWITSGTPNTLPLRFNIRQNGVDKTVDGPSLSFLSKEDYQAHRDRTPYMTIERYWGNNVSNVDYTVKKNGTQAQVRYKMGLTRIGTDEVELTADAQKLGLNYDPVSNYITGILDFSDPALLAGSYQIGLVAKANSGYKATALLKIEDPRTFILRDLANGLNSGENPNVREYANAAYFKNANNGGPIRTDKGNDTDDYQNRDLTYEMKVTTTPFGYYISNDPNAKKTVADATSTTPQYVAGFQLLHPDSYVNFTEEVTITKFEQTGGTSGWELEFIDRNTLANRPFDTHLNTVGALWYLDHVNMDKATMYSTGYDGRTNYESKYPIGPYWVLFKKMGESGTQGSAFVTFKTTDSNGVTRNFRINITTVERSQDGHLTNADVRFEGNAAYTDAVTKAVLVPASSEEQVLGKVELNKINASVVPVRFPDGTEYDASTQTVKKKAGVTLAPGVYTFQVRAVDGHFGDNAPTREMSFKVVDNILAIPHQVWTEGSRIDPIPVSMEHNSDITEIKVIRMGNHADLLADSTGKTINGVATTRTTENQTARLQVSYRNSEGGTDTVYTDFTYEVRPNDNQLDLDVTNAIQTVKEGQRYENMVVTHTEGAELSVITALPKGLRFSPSTKTFSGRGVEAGTYHITILAEKDGLSATKSIHLTVEPGELVADDYVREVVAGDAIEELLIEKPGNATLEFSDWNARDLGNYGLTFNREEATINGTTTRVGEREYTYSLVRTVNGTTQRVNGRITLRITNRPVTVTSNDQTLEVGTAIQNFTIETTAGASIGNINTYLLPPGVTYDSDSKTFSGTPTRVGTFRIPYTASYPNIEGNTTATGWFVLNVTDKYIGVNSGQETVTAGTAIQDFVIRPSEGGEISYISDDQLPSGVTYNRETKTISGRPTKVGRFVVSYTARYPHLSGNTEATGQYVLIVTDKAINVSAGNQTTVVESQMPNLVLTASEGAHVEIVSELPAGLSYDATTKTISGTPKKVGTYILEARASYPDLEGNIEANTTFSITVLPIAADVEVDRDNQQVTLGDDITPVQVSHSRLSDLYLSTPYGDVPESSLDALFRDQYGLRYDSATKTISGTPSRIGTFEFRMKAKNNSDLGGAEDVETFVIKVVPADLDLVISNDAQTILLGSNIRNMVLTHTDGATLDFDETQLPEGLVYDAGTKTISGTPTKAGRYDIQASVTSEDGKRTKVAVARLDVIELPDSVQSADPRLNKIIEGDTAVSGYGTPNATVKVSLPDGTVRETTVGESGTWSITDLPAFEKGQSVDAKQTEKGKTPSDAISATAVPQITKGDNGQDGKSPSVETERGKGTDAAGEEVDGTWVITKDGDGNELSRTFIPDGSKGDKGDKGEDGQNGQNGVDGKSPSVATERGRGTNAAGEEVDGTWVITKDGDGNELSRTFIPDGSKGDKGEDGSPGTILKVQRGRGKDSAGNIVDGTWILNEYDDFLSFIPDGQNGSRGEDGKSPSVETERGKGTNPAGEEVDGTWVITKDGDGNELSRTFIPDGSKGDKGDKGEDGQNGVDGKSPSVATERGKGTNPAGDEVDGTWVITKDGDGNELNRTFIPDGSKGDKGDKGEDGQNGVDGKSPSVATERGRGTNPAGEEVDGTWVITKDGDGNELSRTFIPDGSKGDKGDKGEDGQNGQNGVDGKSPSVATERGRGTNLAGEEVDGTWVITKDGDGNELSRTFIPDGSKGDKGDKGEDGQNGQDGKSPSVATERGKGTNPAGDEVDGTWVITKDVDGNELSRTFIPDGSKGDKGDKGDKGEAGQNGQNGVDGKSPSVATERGRGTNPAGDEVDGTWVITKDGDGNELTRTFIPDGSKGDKGDKGEDGQNGQDGKSPSVATERGKGTNPAGEEVDGTWVITKDGDGNELSRTFIPDGSKGDKGDKGEDGQNGQNGVDGKSPSVATERGKGTNSAGEEVDGTWVITKDGDGNELSRTFIPDGSKGDKGDKGEKGEAGQNGQNGVDGKSPSVATERGRGTNPAGDEVDGTWVITRDGDGTEIARTFIPDGQNGQNGRDGVDGKSPSVATERGRGTNPAGEEVDGTWVITKDGDGNELNRTFIPDGSKGDKGDRGEDGQNGQDGQNGRDGVDGKSPSVATERGRGTNAAGEEVDGTWVITRDGDGTEIARTFIPDGQNGQNGRDGVDGKSPSVATERGRGTNPAGEEVDGTWVITKDGDGNELSRTFIPDGSKGDKGDKGEDGRDGRNGIDGKSPTVEATPGVNTEGHTGIWVIIRDGNGNEISREFVRDGKDGKTPVVTTVPGKNTDGHTGIWV
ncbi:putative Ig domain-containing protein, partial [Streptococcus azizii]